MLFKKKKTEEENEKLTPKVIIGYVVSLLCLVLCIFITIEIINSTRESRPPRIFGISVSYVPTASMEPEIMAGDYVVYHKTTYAKVDVGDIIVYRSKTQDKYIIHRIIEKNADYIIVKGDNNTAADSEHITPDMIYGKYMNKLSLMKIFSGGIQKNVIYFLLIGIFVVMIGMQVLSMVVKEKTEKIKEESAEQKKLLLEQMKNEILQEELAKLKALNEQKNKKEDEDNTTE